MKASRKVSSFLRTVTCLTRERFHKNRNTKVVMRITRINVRSSVIASCALRALTRPWIIYLLIIFFFSNIINGTDPKKTSPEWVGTQVYTEIMGEGNRYQ